jgi:hypothetical protein
MAEQMDPEKTMCVCYHNSKEVGRVPATAPRAVDYIDELARQYGSLEVKYETLPDCPLLAALHSR